MYLCMYVCIFLIGFAIAFERNRKLRGGDRFHRGTDFQAGEPDLTIVERSHRPLSAKLGAAGNIVGLFRFYLVYI